MLNPVLATILYEMGDLLDLAGDNPFRIRAFRRAAQTVETYPEDFGNLSREQMLAIPGIGKGICDIVDEVKGRGKSAEHLKLKQKFPEGVLQIMRLGGVGPRRAAQLFRELKIDSLPKLEASAKRGLLQKLAGFGDKLEQKILKNIAYAESTGKRLIVTQARALAEGLRAHLLKSPHIQQLELAGSARRWKETVGDLDFLCTSDRPKDAIAHFLKSASIKQNLGAGDTKASVQLASGVQVDFRVVDASSFGAALLYFTGSKEHNVRLRELAQKKGMTLNEYGLFKISDKEQKKPVAGKTEQEVYEKLGMQWIPPELREDRGEIDASLKNQLPDLIDVEDVLGDFHNHTKLSDGAHSLEEMVDAAQKHGWKWFFSGDHSPSLTIAHGLPVPVLKQKMNAIQKLNKSMNDFSVYSSSEVDILPQGKMDYPAETLKELDCVIASVHSRFNQSEQEMTERICTALKNPDVDILGHLSGRLLQRRDSYALNVEEVLQTAKKTETAIEINGQPERQELTDVHVKRAIELGIPLALNTDAHSMQELEHMTLAVHIARRGWAEPKHIINCLSAQEIIEWLH